MNKNDFAPSAPMGWNSYDYYDTSIDEAAVRANADFLAAHLKDAGYEYVVVDIQWYSKDAGSRRDLYQYIPFSQLTMDAYARLLPDPTRFPSSADGSGFRPLADYVHSLGLKFGIHIMRGIPRIAAEKHLPILGSDQTAADIADPSSICKWNPDMYGVRNCAAGQAYYDSLFALYAQWGVDFVKCDDICNTHLYPQNPYSARHEVEMLAKAIEHCGRAIVLSLSPGPALIEEAWHYEKHANLWRVTDDFWDSWDLLKDMFARCELWQKHVSRGNYPDCDMLPVGRLGRGFGEERDSRLSKEEQRSMMTLWCLFGSPLFIGAELPLLDDWTLSLLTNPYILAMHSPDCIPHQILRTENSAIWSACNPTKKECFLALFNLSDQTDTLSVSLDSIWDSEGRSLFGPDTALTLEELWTGASSTACGSIEATLAPHACAVYRLLACDCL